MVYLLSADHVVGGNFGWVGNEVALDYLDAVMFSRQSQKS